MSNGSLTLYPIDPRVNLATVSQLVHHLAHIGLLGDPLDEAAVVFRVGERFLQLISFLGCSPYLQLDPPADGGDDFCHLAILGPFATPRLLYGEDTRPPRCPSCGAAMRAWREEISSGNVGCRECGTRHPLERIEWRKHAGYGRLFVEIRNIFPGEAVPVDELLTRLQDLGCGEWGYFYRR